MSNYNWYCATCGGNNIQRDAILTKCYLHAIWS